ncbi:MAG TPA: cell wall-binding repeat-containing protein [Acidothermaceae bacterium]
MRRSKVELIAAGTLATALVGTALAVPWSAASAAIPTPTWSASPTSSTPPNVQGSTESTVFDPATGQLLDVDSAVTSCNTFTWDGAAWAKHNQMTGPGWRSAPALGYDAATKQVVMFGGFGDPTCPQTDAAYSLDDTWTWNGSIWTQQHPATVPPQATDGCAAYDPASGHLIMFGGNDVIPTAGGEAFGDTWQWTGTNWVKLTPASHPPANGQCYMTDDEARGDVVLLIYSGQTASGDANVQTWTWDGSNWSQVANFPVPDALNPISYDAQSKDDLVYVAETGPCTNTSPTTSSCPEVDEVWAFDGTAWAKVSSSGPEIGSDTTDSVDAATHQLVALGGIRSAPSGFVLNSKTWVYASAGSSPASPVRLSGANRQATAVAASKAQFPTTGSASAVILARADVFADALAGGPLAAAKHAPLLLTSSSSLDDVTKAEIQRVLPSGGTVYLLGGTSALSDDVAAAITALGDVPMRVSGADRFATAVAIADAMGDPTTVFEASGADFPDALSAVPAAIKEHAAILLTNGSAQAQSTSAYLTAHATTRYSVGGPAAWADPSAIALAGATRYDTSAAVALAFFPNTTGIDLASALTFPDALAAGPLAGAAGHPVLLVPPSGALPEPFTAYLSTHAATVSAVDAFGGTSALSATVLSAVGAALR